MRVDGELVWWSPPRRGVIPVDGLRARLARFVARPAEYEIRVDTAFAEVIGGCADPTRPHGWIDDSLRRCVHAPSCARLGALGRSLGRGRASPAASTASVVGGLFAAESKFHRRSGASKAALLALLVTSRRSRWRRGSSMCSGRRPTCDRSGPSRSRGPSTTCCSTRRSRFPTHSADNAVGRIVASDRRRRARLQDSRPMSFVRPITNNNSTSPMPTIDTRS